jgi:hypothetical protein
MKLEDGVRSMVWGAAPRRVAVVTLPVLLRVLLGTLQDLLPRPLQRGELQLVRIM